MSMIETGTDIPQAFIDRIADWFCDSFGDPYHNPRMDKSLGLYRLASQVREGVIIELGAYQGNGAISLASGAPLCPVYTVDDYNHRIDWMGNEPGGEDREILHGNIEESGLPIVHLDKSVSAALKDWRLPIGLLFWDTGSNEMLDDFNLWQKHIVSGGMFVMHDTDDFTFHSNEVTKAALALGWTLGPQYRTLYTVVKP
jgi:hypothetical protein